MKKTRSVTDAIRHRVFSLCDGKQYEKAIKEVENFLKRAHTAKQKTVGLRMIAYVLHSQKRKAEAAGLLLGAAGKHPRDRAIHYTLIMRLIDCARYREAIQFAERLIHLDRNRRWRPFTDSAHFHKAYALLKLGKLDEAEKELRCVKDEGNIWIEGDLSSKPLLLEQIARERRKQ